MIRIYPLCLALTLGTAALLACGCNSSTPATGTGGTTAPVAEDPSLTQAKEKFADDKLTGEVKVDGSSTVFPVTEAVAEEFKEALPNVQVTVGISGTGGGFKKFGRGETDISNASRPILKAEAEAAAKEGIEFVELPVCYDALTVAVHPSCDWIKDDTITIDQLKMIWEPAAQGKILKWNQVDPSWPDAELKLFGPGADSGTFDYFTEVVTGKAKQSRGDFTGSEDDNTLVQGISGDKYALGYLPYAYFEPNSAKMKALKIKKGDADAVGPSAATVKDGSYALSRPLFVYVSLKSLERPEVAKFSEFYLDTVTALATEVKYVPFEPALYELVKDRLAKKLPGSMFGGEAETHQSLEEALKAAAK
ncbi:Phosphate-binding protein PstS precursor [Anatilimnocola aggregata]|uniref:Phosphate-binding protein n=1 Tax=Anatilimnocola aggregata TaxID=2528021 RepID=A0A517YEE4_9BACT|nr:PstS family phosphate ABC transporter substrate-binding protein [Anatilimnocola aggregata]QDU28599.1 Phosphate-binding protein PstS precursor [Anatilimnocola aggregata]